MKAWAVDVPDFFDLEGPWIALEYFKSKEEALKYAKEFLGADDEGKISLISEVEDYSEEDDD